MRMVADILHRRGSVDQRIRPCGIPCSVDGIAQYERVEAHGKIDVRDRLGFTVGAEGIGAPWNDEDRFSFFVEGKVRRCAGDVARKRHIGPSFY